jgi:hypothetical protein
MTSVPLEMFKGTLTFVLISALASLSSIRFHGIGFCSKTKKIFIPEENSEFIMERRAGQKKEDELIYDHVDTQRNRMRIDRESERGIVEKN